jgi:hypothetical protein
MSNESYWSLLKNNFKDIINTSEYYNKLFNFIHNFENNILLYGKYGYPSDLFIEEVIKYKFNISTIYRNECVWNKNVIYNENQNFFEIDLINPNMPKDFSFLSELILHIIKSKSIINVKHFIIIKHIDILVEQFFTFRILLERFTDNAYFLCTTHNISKIEMPIKSRFTCIRMPLFYHNEIINIFENYLHIKLNKYLIQKKTRDIIHAIFIAEVEKNEPHLITDDFCNYNFPPICDFLKTFNKKNNNLESIRQFSYKCCQYNISILDLSMDILKHVKNKKELLSIASNIEHTLILTNKGREPIYIESLLCQMLL